MNQVGLSRKHIFDAVDASVARLGTYIDVLQIHRLDRGTPREEIMKALNDVVDSGKVRYIGASSVSHLSCLISRSILSEFGSCSQRRWQPGSSTPYKTLLKRTAGTNSSPCKITTTSSTVRKSAK